MLNKYQLFPKKSLGQNFLVDNNVLEKIVQAAKLTRETAVLEIGPGMGSLTVKLAQRAGEVLALELDTRLLPVLQEILHDYTNVQVVSGDVLKLDPDQLMLEKTKAQQYKVVANLPYYITTPVIFKFLEQTRNALELVIMVQQEVAERMIALPGSKAYGVMTVAVAYYSRATILTKVKRTVFFPRPEVDSAVVRLEILPASTIEVEDQDFYFKLVKGAFNQRRKTLINALNSTLGIDKEVLKDVIATLEFDPGIRGESLSPAEYAALARALGEYARH